MYYLVFILLVSGCTSEISHYQPPKPELIVSFFLRDQVICNSPHTLTADLTNTEYYSISKYEWSATGGFFDTTNNTETTWYAPKEPGTDKVYFTV